MSLKHFPNVIALSIDSDAPCPACGVTACAASPVKQTTPLCQAGKVGRSYIDSLTNFCSVDSISFLKKHRHLYALT